MQLSYQLLLYEDESASFTDYFMAAAENYVFILPSAKVESRSCRIRACVVLDHAAFKKLLDIKKFICE
jgi:hypothetical protein